MSPAFTAIPPTLLALMMLILVAMPPSFVSANGGPGGHPRPAPVPKWCQSNSRSFALANAAQLAAISANPETDIWYQNITVSTTLTDSSLFVPVVNYGYWQLRRYSSQSCAFEEIQLWYRDANTVAIQQINSYLYPAQTLTPGSIDSKRPAAAFQGYDVVWVTPETWDSVGLTNRDVDIVSQAVSSDTVYVSFTDKSTGALVFSEEMRAVTPMRSADSIPRCLLRPIQPYPSGLILTPLSSQVHMSHL